MRLLRLFAICATLLAQGSSIPAIESKPALPNVLLIGDSISIGYTEPVQRLLAARANVHRISGNAGPTSNGVFLIDSWLGTAKWDVIHFNFGLHDLKRLDDGHPQVRIEDYARYLELVVKRLKRTGARLVWATTTPVPEGKVSPPRVPADVVQYNATARRIMEANGVAINDLHSFALSRLSEIQRPVNVHFTPAGSELLGREVAKTLEQALADK